MNQARFAEWSSCCIFNPNILSKDECFITKCFKTSCHIFKSTLIVM